MAALVLSVAGGALGGLLGPAGATVGRLAGAIVGNIADQALFGGSGDNQRAIAGPRMASLDVMASSEGAPIPRVYGRVRISGQVIWATKLEEVVTTRSETSSSGGGGGKGGGGGRSVTTTTTTYSYYANFAVGLCEGEIGAVMRVWADGKPLDLSGVTMRQYRGTQDQSADPLIVAKEGAVPAYRGLAYVVFEKLPVENFGNRIPQLSFEVMRPVGALERMTRAVTLIPGSTEFGYEPATVVRTLGPGQSAPENRHVTYAPSDVIASLDALQAACPNLERVALVVSWFGTDLRASECEIFPCVDNAEKSTFGATWSVAGIARGNARLVSRIDGRPAFGGTPSDTSVIHLIQELKARRIKVTLYPFLLMDIAAGNTRADPYTGAASQPVYPWRGRITCTPAPGARGSPDGSSAAAAQLATFFTRANGYRRFILHYAQLAAQAGGVEGFLIGSELKALTRVRSASGVYPAVDALVSLANDVKAQLPKAVITYGADWTEYGAHVVDADAREVRFPLDALWSSPAIGAIGIDYYAPLSDWRDDASHADRALGASIYDPNYLKSRLTAGEAYDWYYASDTARRAQTRTPISDALNKPWVFRQKDLWSFWSQPHYDRVNGVERSTPTAWTPKSKPIWLTELGCPAVDKRANQPSVFPDPKSSEAGLPYFSNGQRDDLMQRRYCEAALSALDPDKSAALNPLSNIYNGRMFDLSAIHLWTWDARPFPAFPDATDAWSDGPNWETGHWLTGRLGGTPLDGLVAAVLNDCSITDVAAGELGDGPDGFLVDRPMAPRAMLEQLAQAYAFGAIEESGTLRFRPRGGAPVVEIVEDDLVLPERGAPVRLTRAQETELPREVSLGFTDGTLDYRRAAAVSRRLVGGAAGITQSDVAMVTNAAEAQRRADIVLQDIWAARESAEFALPPSALALSPGDVVALNANGRRHLLELRSINDTTHRAVKAQSIDPEVFDLPLPAVRRRAPETPPAVGPVHALILDLPPFDASDPPVLSRVAVFADPWPGPVVVMKSSDGLSFTRAALALAPAIVGETLDDLPRHAASCFQERRCRVRLYVGTLTSIADGAVLNGGNLAAFRNADGAWELFQFGRAELVGENTYALSRLLRGQGGTEAAIAPLLATGAPFVLLDEHVVPFVRGLDALDRPLQLRAVATGRDQGDPTALALTATPGSAALLPLAPVHLAAKRVQGGVLLSWIRRGRFDADGWSGEIPLGESAEQYRVEILANALPGAAVKRSFTVNTPTCLYANADELADFGARQMSLVVRVAQLSATVGAGRATTITLTP